MSTKDEHWGTTTAFSACNSPLVTAPLILFPPNVEELEAPLIGCNRSHV